MPKKRIFFIVNTNVYSGAEAVNIRIINSLKDKYDFFWVSAEGPINEYLDLYHIKHISIEKVSISELKRIIKEYNPDILHATDYKASVICSLSTSKIPIISHLHNNSPWLTNPIHPNSLAYLYAGLKVKTILTVSDSIKDEYIYSKLINNKIKNISNPISREDILETVSSSNKKYDLCFVGRLTEQKNPLRLINIVSSLKEEFPKIKLVMVGEGELRSDCEQKIKELSLEKNIKLMGFQKNPYQYMNESKIFILPSNWEGFGLVVFEAMTLGLPCLITSVGGMKHLVSSNCGYICTSNEEFKNHIIELLQDKTRYQQLSKGAIKRSKELDNSNSYYKELNKLYKKIK